jgi:hypothetical protein
LKSGVVEAGSIKIEAGSVVFAACELPRIRAGRARRGRVAEGFKRVLGLRSARRVREFERAAQRIDDRGLRPAAIRAGERLVDRQTGQHIGCRRAARQLLDEVQTVIQEDGGTAVSRSDPGVKIASCFTRRPDGSIRRP